MAAPVVDLKPLNDYAVPTEEEPHCSIMHPHIGANNFEFKPSWIRMIQQDQFSELPSENPNLHLSNFVDNYGTIEENNIDQNSIHIRLFPFSMRDRARD